MDALALRDKLARQGPALVQRLAELVTCESPSNDVPALKRCAELLAGWGDDALRRRGELVTVDGRPHLLWQAYRPGPLIMGHFDTVWPAGTVNDWPFSVEDGIARGPGVFDMKAGIIQAFAAIGALSDVSKVSVLWTSDEEIGSTTSRALIAESSRRASAVLVCEPSADGGAVKIGRKGIANYQVHVEGLAAHAGLEPWLGVNAGMEMARQILAVADLGASEEETTVTPTVAAAGTTTNTVPATAWFTVDARAWTAGELDRVDRAMRRLAPFQPEASLVVEGGIDRPPWEPQGSLGLLAEVQAAADEVGLPRPDGVRSGGGSDGNLTAAAGVPTLDGLGAIGAHPHGRGERVDVTAMPDRAALLAALIERLCREGDC